MKTEIYKKIFEKKLKLCNNFKQHKKRNNIN